jgi:cytochrome b involved in lipid metabolism
MLLSPLYGLPVRDNLPEYTYEEVYTHDRPDSYWLVIDSHVYDVTRYAARHPGGGIDATFARSHGTDVGVDFNAIHGWKEKCVTSKFLIGRIKPGSVSTRIAKPRRVAALNLSWRRR